MFHLQSMNKSQEIKKASFPDIVIRKNTKENFFAHFVLKILTSCKLHLLSLLSNYESANDVQKSYFHRKDTEMEFVVSETHPNSRLLETISS